MFMLMHIKGSACLCLFHRVNQALILMDGYRVKIGSLATFMCLKVQVNAVRFGLFSSDFFERSTPGTPWTLYSPAFG